MKEGLLSGKVCPLPTQDIALNLKNRNNAFKNLLLTILILLDSTRIQSNRYPMSRLTSSSTQAPVLPSYPRNTLTHGVISALLVLPLPVHSPTTLFTRNHYHQWLGLFLGLCERFLIRAIPSNLYGECTDAQHEQ